MNIRDLLKISVGEMADPSRWLFPVSIENPEGEDERVTAGISLGDLLLAGSESLDVVAEDGTPIELTFVDSGATMPDGRKIFVPQALEKR